MKDVKIVIVDHQTINLAWRIFGGTRQWEEVRSFACYDKRSKKFYVFLPPNADEELVRYEFDHILRWRADLAEQVTKEDKMSYKEGIQEFADDIASQRYDKDFYDLTEKQQYKVYEEAQERYIDHYVSLADSMVEERKFK